MVGRRLHDWQAMLKQRQAKASPGRRRRVHISCLCDDRRLAVVYPSVSPSTDAHTTHARRM
jgi:hypothetical protein